MHGYIVEGFNDEFAILQVIPDAFVVVLKGTRFDNRVRININEALEKCDKLFILTDPDDAGDIIASMILEEYPQLPRIHIKKEEAMCYRNRRWKCGVEHCSTEYLREVLL